METHHLMAGRIMEDIINPETRSRGWVMFEKVRAYAKDGFHTAMLVRESIRKIARKLSGKAA